MKKIILVSLFIMLSASISQCIYAEQVAPECAATWLNSEASKSCGENYCTSHNMNFFSHWGWYFRNPEKVFISSYDAQKRECMFQTLCVTDPNGNPYMKSETELFPTTDRLSGPREEKNNAGYYSKTNKKATCYSTVLTVKVGDRLKNENGQLKLDNSSANPSR